MRELLSLIWLMFALVTFGSTAPSEASAFLPTCSFRAGTSELVTVGYDVKKFQTIACDGAIESIASGKKHQTQDGFAYFVNFGGFLAAETTAGAGLKLAGGAQDMVAGTQNGILLGTVENGRPTRQFSN